MGKNQHDTTSLFNNKKEQYSQHVDFQRDTNQESLDVFIGVDKKMNEVCTKTEGSSASSMDWPSLQHCVSECTLCPLHKTRTKSVFGVGNKNASIMFIGEAPGANEDLQGEPFVGRAGKLLDNMLLSIGLTRETIFIANVIKCRPPENRDPLPEEVSRCTPYLNRQIEIVQPKLLVALGRVAAHYLLNTNLPLARLRQSFHSYGDSKTPLFVTFHPAYLLRSPKEKSRAFEDLLKIKEFAINL